MLALADAGFRLLVPFGENTRYDLVVDDNERLLRVQCKTGRLRNGAVFFATSSTYGHHKNVTQRRRQYFGEIDVFGVYCAATGGVYVVPIDAVPVRCHAALRVDEPAQQSAATDPVRRGLPDCFDLGQPCRRNG